MKPRVCSWSLWALWTVGCLYGAEARPVAACGFDADTAAVSDEAYRFLSEVEIHAAGLTPAELQAYYQTRYRVQKVYPYARMAGERFRLY
ncbi:MAG: DUF4294 domain-containing protein, partial [Bacteroidales bacterium]|nr:DUF4294 domain-containing protein [Bacteroidales bacterium]